MTWKVVPNLLRIIVCAAVCLVVIYFMYSLYTAISEAAAKDKYAMEQCTKYWQLPTKDIPRTWLSYCEDAYWDGRYERPQCLSSENELREEYKGRWPHKCKGIYY